MELPRRRKEDLELRTSVPRIRDPREKTVNVTLPRCYDGHSNSNHWLGTPVHDCAGMCKMQSMESLRVLPKGMRAFEALGNAVNVTVATAIMCALMALKRPIPRIDHSIAVSA